MIRFIIELDVLVVPDFVMLIMGLDRCSLSLFLFALLLFFLLLLLLFF